MTRFKYIEEKAHFKYPLNEKEILIEQTAILREIAFQLRRIADKLQRG